MHLTNHEIVRKLPLSHTIYQDNEIDASKAEQLVVYHYPLAKSYRWKEWQEHLDSELSDRYYPYLMRSYNGQSGLFVALNTPDEKPPVIKNSDGIKILPERIRYAPEMNPIWIRLIMRKAAAFGSHCKGSHTLGRPLLKIDVWQGKKSTGINAISLDCRTQQLADRNTTEVVLFYENVPLRPFSKQEDSSKYRGSLWTYGKNSVLVRWIPTHGDKPQGTLYKEIQKSSDRRMQRPFIDLSSVKALKSSWPCIFKSVQDELIKQAAIFGFTLKPKVLNLTPLPLRTKYKSNPSTRSLIPSMALNILVEVLDLRMTKAIPATEIVELIQQVLDDKKLGTKLRLLPNIDPDDIDKIEFYKNQRVLIVLDQLKGVVEDRYPLTQILRTKVACQHINVNPNDLVGDSVESNLLIEQSDSNDNTYLIPEADSKYYEYDISQFDQKQCREMLKRNAEIAIKELELKHLLLSRDAKISTSLSEQKELLTENLIVVTEGYLFTVRDDRPIILPFNPAVSNQVKDCDDILYSFDTSVGSLLTLLQQNWPYSYKPEAVMQGFGSPAEKLSRFARQLTIVIHKSDTVSISFQDPKYDKPRMIPLNLDEAVKTLKSQNLELPIQKWQLPQKGTIVRYTEQLVEDGELTSEKKDALLQELDSLTNCWNATLRDLFDQGLMQVDYKKLKQGCLNRFLEKKNACLGLEEKPKVRNNPILVSSWTKLLSRIFELPLEDVRAWLRNVPGIQRLWHDPEQGYYVVGGLAPLKMQIQRQPSIRQWHALQGELDTELLTALIDVDWVRTNQLAGNPCVATLVKRWLECQSSPSEALKN
jgi:hypothetical protein